MRRAWDDYAHVFYDYEDKAVGSQANYQQGVISADGTYIPTVADVNGNKMLHITATSERNFKRDITSTPTGDRSFTGVALHIQTDADMTLRLYLNYWNNTALFMTKSTGYNYTLVAADGTKTTGAAAKAAIPAGFNGWIVINNDQFSNAGGWSNVANGVTYTMNNIYWDKVAAILPVVETTAASLNCYVDNIMAVKSMGEFMASLTGEGQLPPASFEDLTVSLFDYENKTVNEEATFNSGLSFVADQGTPKVAADGDNNVLHITANNLKNFTRTINNADNAAKYFSGLALYIKTDAAIGLHLYVNAQYGGRNNLLRTKLNGFSYTLIDKNGVKTAGTAATGSLTATNNIRAAAAIPAGYEGWFIVEASQFQVNPGYDTSKTLQTLSWDCINTVLPVVEKVNTEAALNCYVDNIVAVLDTASLCDLLTMLEVTNQPADAVASTGSTATFSASLIGNGTMAYQWQKSTDDGANWIAIPGATSNSYTTNTLTKAEDKTQFRVVVTYGEAPQIYTWISASAMLTVVGDDIPDHVGYMGVLYDYENIETGTQATEQQAAFVANGGIPTIAVVDNNKMLHITDNNNNNFKRVISGINDSTKHFSGLAMYVKTDAEINLQMFVTYWVNTGLLRTKYSGFTYSLIDADGIMTSKTTNTKAAKIPADFEGWFVVDNAQFEPSHGWALEGKQQTLNGISWDNITAVWPIVEKVDGDNPLNCYVDNIVAITDMAAFSAAKSALEIAKKPEKAAAYVGETATFSVTAVSAGQILYQWQQSTDNGSNWSDIVNATQAAYTTAATTKENHGTLYRVIVRSADDPQRVVWTSDGVALGVRKQNSTDYMTVLQDFFTCEPGTLKGVGLGGQYNAVVRNDTAAAIESITISENEEGDKSLTLKAVEKLTTAFDRMVVHVALENAPPEDTEAIAIRVTHPVVSEPVDLNTYKDQSGLYPGFRITQINLAGFPNTTMTGWDYPPAWLFVQPHEDYTDIPATAYLIDKTNAVTAFDLQQRSQTISNKYRAACIAPNEFEGWVVLPKEMFVNNKTFINEASNEANYGGKYQPMDWKWSDVTSLGLAYECPENGFEPTIHEIVAVTDLPEFLAMYPSAEMEQDPQDVVTKTGGQATFTCKAKVNGDIRYQWQKSKDGGKTWTDIADATQESYTASSLTAADNKTMFRVMVTADKVIGSAVVYSAAATLYVDSLPDLVIEYTTDSIETVPANVFEKYKGLDAYITIKVNEEGALKYSWSFYGKNIKTIAEFDPTVDMLSTFQLGLGVTAFDALYFDVKSDAFPGEAAFVVDVQYNFQAGNTLYMYSQAVSGGEFVAMNDTKPILADSYATVALSAGGLYLMNNQKLAVTIPEVSTEPEITIPEEPTEPEDMTPDTSIDDPVDVETEEPGDAEEPNGDDEPENNSTGEPAKKPTKAPEKKPSNWWIWAVVGIVIAAAAVIVVLVVKKRSAKINEK